MKKGYTYGAELEYADVNRTQLLPHGCLWDRKDYTIVNSNGVANDPLGELCIYGGEINTRPTDSIKDQVHLFDQINKFLLPSPVVNYRCNLHIHIGVPGLRDNLKLLKRLLVFIVDNSFEAYKIVDPIPHPNRFDYPSNEAYSGAMTRFKRRLKSHQHQLPKSVVQSILAASTTDEFFINHAPKSNGNPVWHLMCRAGINLFQMYKETPTIEFRHFPGTTNSKEFESALVWCDGFTRIALGHAEGDLKHLSRSFDFKFPRFMKYDHELELGYRNTSINHVPRSELKKRILL